MKTKKVESYREKVMAVCTAILTNREVFIYTSEGKFRVIALNGNGDIAYVRTEYGTKEHKTSLELIDKWYNQVRGV